MFTSDFYLCPLWLISRPLRQGVCNSACSIDQSKISPPHRHPDHAPSRAGLSGRGQRTARRRGGRSLTPTSKSRALPTSSRSSSRTSSASPPTRPRSSRPGARPRPSKKCTTARSCWAARMSACCPKRACEKPHVDIVVRGEGEDAWIDICNRLEAYLADQPEYHTEAFMHPENEVFDDCLGLTYNTSDGRSITTRTVRPSPTWTACPGPPTISSRWSTTPICSRRPTSVMAPQFQHHDQPRLSLSLHLLHPEHHAHQVAQPQPGERDGRVAASGRGPGRPGDRRPG